MLKPAAFPLILLSFFNPPNSSSQTDQIKGSIQDAKSNKSLAFANVFLNKTTIGVVADSSGHFQINNVPVGTYEIVGSFIGYVSFRNTIEIKEGKILYAEIKLTGEARKLDEVIVVVKKDKEWERNLQKFNRIFLGTGKEAKGCRIVNPWILDFNYENISGRKIFSAKAPQPLEIENLYLGYRLFYYLKDFSAQGGAYSTVAYSIFGDQRFEALKTNDTTIIKQWNNRRMETYVGSYRHLFKAIVDHRLKEEGFDLFFENETKKDVFNPKSASTTNSMALDPNKIKVSTLAEGHYKIELLKTEVHYKRRYISEGGYTTYDLEVSLLNPKNGFLVVDSNGVVLNSADLVVSGAMFENRVASHLPNDFQPIFNVKQ